MLYSILLKCNIFVNRRMIFEKNMKFIRDHNMEADLGHKTFRVGINEYADLVSIMFIYRSKMNLLLVLLLT